MKIKNVAAAIAVLGIGVPFLSVSADTITWTGAGDGAFWSDPNNWDAHRIPQSGDSVIASARGDCNVTNDIVGLSLPYLELRHDKNGPSGGTAYHYANFYGKQITLTGGLNAFKAAYTNTGTTSVSSPVLRNYIPLHLDSGIPGGTNKFTIALRILNFGDLTGPDYLWIYYGNVAYDAAGNDMRTAGVTAEGSALFDVSGANGLGNGAYPARYLGSSTIRLYANPNWYLVVEQSSTSADSKATALTYGNRTINGYTTGTRFVFQFNSSAGGTCTINGNIDIPDGPVHFIRPEGNPCHAIINGQVNIGHFGRYYQELGGNVTFNHENNAIANFYSLYQNAIAGARNAFGTNAVVRFGYRSDSHGMMEMAGWDQTIDRFALNSSYPIDAEHPEGHLITSTVGTPVLTMAATDNCETDAKFGGTLSLVWAPKGAYTFRTYASYGRDMPMTGKITVSNGVFEVNGANAFPKASGVEVAPGASFVWASTRATGLKCATSLSLGEGASFTVSSGAAIPFPTNDFIAGISLNLAPGATLSLPSGTTLPALSVTTGEVTFAVGTVLSGDSGVPDAVYLPQLSAGARIRVVERDASIPETISSYAYVQDGLLCHLDGIENAGRGTHDSNSAVWKDLCGVAGDFTVTAGTGVWTENGLFKAKTGTNEFGCIATKTSQCAVPPQTLEAAVSDIASATGDGIIPFHYSADRYICIRKHTEFMGKNNSVFEPESMPDRGTFSVVYDTAPKYYLNGTGPEDGVANDTTWTGSWNYMTLGARWVSWGSTDGSSKNFTVNGVRLYDRMLTDEEIRLNSEVDGIRFRGVIPANGIRYRANAGDPDWIDCRFDYSIAGGTISVNGAAGVTSGVEWPMLGAKMVLSADCAAGHRFVCWAGDTNAIVSGTAESLSVTVRVDRALSVAAVTAADQRVVTEDTRLTQNVTCSGIRFTGPWTLSADDGVRVSVEEYGNGIVVDEGTVGTATITCPVTIGIVAGGDEQKVTVPSGATLEISGAVDGITPLCFTGEGVCWLTGGGGIADNLSFDLPEAHLSGTFSDTSGIITMSPTSLLYLANVDLGKRVDVTRSTKAWCFIAASSTNYLRSGYRQATGTGSPTDWFSLGANSETTFETSFNAAGVSGIYPTLGRTSGTGSSLAVVHMRTDTDKIASLTVDNGVAMHVWKPMFVVNRSYYDRLQNGARMYLHCEYALTKAPWSIRGYLDLGGFDQTMGRFSYVSEVSSGTWNCYTTGVVHSDEPATLTVYHDTNANGTGNIGWQAFGGKFTGYASLVKTGASNDAAMTTNDLVLAGTSTSTGSVAVTWGLLSFGDFTSNNVHYVGSWTTCTSATASVKGVLELCHSKALGKGTDVYVGEGGKVRLSSGVSQRVRELYIEDGSGNWVRQQHGVWGGASSSARHKSAAFEGAGVLRVYGEGHGVMLTIR